MGTAAFGKTRQEPLRPRLRAQRGRPLQPRRAVSTVDVPQEEWYSIPVPAIVEPEVVAAVQEQWRENRRHARQSRRGALSVLQDLLQCQHCGYAYYGKRRSPRARKGKPRAYAYERCLGTDAYRFGGERVCQHPQVRTDLLDVAVWQEVCTRLAHPETRATRPSLATGEAQIGKLRHGVARLLDRYAESLIDKDEFEPRITRLRQRLARLEEQRQAGADEAALQTALQLIIGRLEDFATKVHSGLEAADWASQRDRIRTLVKRVEVARDQVNIVFRVDPYPDDADPEKKSWQLCRGSECPALWSAFFGRQEFSTVDHTRLPPGFDVPPDRGTGVDLSEQSFVINTVEAFGSIGIQNPCGLLVDADIDGSNRIPGRASRSQSVTVWCKARFPLWLKRHFDQSLEGSVKNGRDTERPLLVRCRFGYPDPSDGLCRVVESPGVDQGQSLGWREGLPAVNPSRLLALVILRDPTYCYQLSGPGCHQQSLARADSSDLTTTLGSVHALLALQHHACDFLPRERVPSIHRLSSNRVHSVLAPTCPFTFQAIVLTSAYPLAFPEALAF